MGKILNDPSKPASRFEGYAVKAETEKKILRDVFEKGDTWFRTGDLLRKDAEGCFYFVDRIGDTFRWKGENVATAEVEEVIAAIDGVAEAIVYGVAVPGNDGWYWRSASMRWKSRARAMRFFSSNSERAFLSSDVYSGSPPFHC